MKNQNSVRRGGCGCRCRVGREVCVECEEVRASRKGWAAVVLLHEKVRV